MKIYFTLFLYIIIISISYSGQTQLKIVNQQVEGLLTDEKCIDIIDPRFSWQILSEIKGKKQTAFRLIVASSKENIHNNIGDMYDSKKIISSENTYIPYKGKSLESAKIYYWKVKVWVNDITYGIWSKEDSWTSGLIYPKDKKAKWISNKNENIRAPLFRQEFVINKPIKNAFAYTTGIGIYYFFVNGNRMGDAFIEPGMTDYKSRILYSCYDLKQSLKQGRNVIGLFMGEGMGAFSYSRKDRFKNINKINGPFDKPMGWVQLIIEYKDGSKETIVSNSSWKSNSSQFKCNNSPARNIVLFMNQIIC